MSDPTKYWLTVVLLLTCITISAILFLTLRTRHKRWRRIVRHQGKRFREMAENINEVFYETDASGEEMLYINPAYEEIWGRTRESLYEYPLSWLNSIHPEDLERVSDTWRNWMTRDRFSEEYRIIRPDGTIRWILDRVVPIRDKSRKVVRIVGCAEDVTNRKEVETELKKRSEQQQVVNRLLRLPVEQMSLEEMLERSINIILSTGWMTMLSRCGIFLIEDDPNTLILKAQKGLAPEVLAMCKQVPLNHCICGKAAANKKVYFVDRVDAHHQNCYDNMPKHGHYIAPIMLEGTILGVVMLYVKEGHLSNTHEKTSIEMIGSALASLISRKRTDNVLRTMNETLEQRVNDRSIAAEQRTQELIMANAELDTVMKELRTANERLEKLCALDPLTDLLCRRGLQDVLTREVQWSKREGSTLLALLLDLDNFKQVNDTLGYAVGDVLLKEIAHKLKSCVRTTDHVARIGGDEFMVLMPHTRSAEGVRVAEKVRLAVLGQPSLISTGDVVATTTSAGLVPVPRGNASLDELVSQAHLALARSKQAGKNRVSYGGRIERGRNKRENLLSVELLEALRRGEQLSVVAQPIFALENRKTIGYELLSRSSINTFEMPDDFFRASLDANILTAVDHQCFKRCMSASSLLPQDTCCHLNIFPSTLINVPLTDLLESLPPNEKKGGAYCIEISEQQIIGEPSYLARSVNKLKKAGFMIAIDDVGFGRSSLESLVVLEPHIVKIDRRCVSGIGGDWARTESLKRFLKAVRALDSEVVAEGIEMEGDLAVLKDLGVNFGQGFLLGRPVSIQELDCVSEEVRSS